MKSNAKKVLLKLFQSKFILISIGFFIGAIFGIYFINNQYQANMLAPKTSTLVEKDLATIFTEYKEIKEVEITSLSDNIFFVKFLATEGEGDSLHPFAYEIKKTGGILLSVKDVEI